MQKAERLTKRADYASLYRRGRSWSNSLVVLRVLSNSSGKGRCGFTVSKRVGKAVVRNRVRRLLREAVRLTPIKAGWDMVFIARPTAATAGYHQIKGAVDDLLSKAGLLEKQA